MKIQKHGQEKQHKLWTHQKFELRSLALKRHEKFCCLLEEMGFSFIAALIRVTQTDPGREKQRKRSDSRSWLTALINKSVAKEWALCISSLSLWGPSRDNREMPENNSWLLKQILYSPSGCIHVCSCRIFFFNEDFQFVELIQTGIRLDCAEMLAERRFSQGN